MKDRDGIAIDETPDFGGSGRHGGFSSTIMRAAGRLSLWRVIYAGAQKNIGPGRTDAGVIVREDLLGKAHEAARPSSTTPS